MVAVDDWRQGQHSPFAVVNDRVDWRALDNVEVLSDGEGEEKIRSGNRKVKFDFFCFFREHESHKGRETKGRDMFGPYTGERFAERWRYR